MTITLTLRRLGGTQIFINADPTDTVATVKSVLERDHGIDSKTCRLHYRGKVLADDESVSSINLEPNNFIIIIPHGNNIRPPPPPPPPPPPGPSPPITPPRTNIKPPSEIAHPSVDPLPSLFTNLHPWPSGVPTNFLSPTPDPPNFSELVTNLMDAVPFPREQCERALRVCGFRLEQAASLLLEPGDDQMPLLENYREVLDFGMEGGDESTDPPDFSDLVARLVEVVQQPQENCIDALRQAGYDLETAAALLLTGIPQTEAASQPERRFQQQPAPMPDFVAPEDQTFESFTEEEKAQIIRLQEITGRDRAYVIQIFVACDKNEEVTANCLLEGK